ncbi:hypothetical protein [Streptomyces sp. NPDC093598]|uniref:hypothetical protein n=1 Tax=Streptomyces sp. NPDC093598 TaxID=3366046 RepID=UPI0037FAA416
MAVTAASVSAAGTQLLADVAARHLTITKAWADNGYKAKAGNAAHLGIDLEMSNATPLSAASKSGPAAGSSNAPSAGPRLGNPPPPISSRDPTGRHQPHDPPPHPRNHHQLA